MMKPFSIFCLITIFVVPAWTGVVFEVETKDHGDSGKAGTTQISAEGKNLKMDIQPGDRGGESEAIFHGDRREMVVVDHNNKAYMVIDQEAIKAIVGQVGSMMSQMEEALKNVPESQRAMVEEMMKKKMPQKSQKASLNIEARKAGGKKKVNGYPTIGYEVLVNGKRSQELWVTPWSNIEGGKDAKEAFGEMGSFFKEMMEAFSSMGGGDKQTKKMGGAFFAVLEELDGFPVVTKSFNDDGSLDTESELRSSKRMKLDPADFEPPAGYKRQQMFGGK